MVGKCSQFYYATSLNDTPGADHDRYNVCCVLDKQPMFEVISYRSGKSVKHVSCLLCPTSSYLTSLGSTSKHWWADSLGSVEVLRLCDAGNHLEEVSPTSPQSVDRAYVVLGFPKSTLRRTPCMCKSVASSSVRIAYTCASHRDDLGRNFVLNPKVRARLMTFVGLSMTLAVKNGIKVRSIDPLPIYI